MVKIPRANDTRVLRALVAVSLVTLASAPLASCADSGSSAVAGLPPDAFERAYAAGYDVASAERCGETLDAGAIRHRLVEDAKSRGFDQATAEKAGRTFDKTRTELTRKLQSRPEFCVSQYSLSPEALALYRKGEFPAAR